MFPSQDLLQSLSSALIKFMSGQSPNVGTDCFLYASLAHQILQRKGFDARVVCGEAGWRVGSGHPDVIAHSPRIDDFERLPNGKVRIPLHAWLVCEGKYIDFTTHTLPIKVQILDAMDGGDTKCEWAPPYLVCSPHESTSLEEVNSSLSPGVFTYVEFPGTYEKLLTARLVGPADSSDSEIVEFLMRSPSTVFHGYNDLLALQEA